MSDTLKLTDPPKSYHFGRDELKQLTDTLASIDQNTSMMPVSQVTQLHLNDEGRTTNGGFRYQDMAFIQLCGLLAPGLAQLAIDLSGQWRRPGADVRLYNPRFAIEVFNKALTLRFERKLIGIQVVRNHKDKTIDGIVGSKYRYLANSDFLSRLSHEMTTATFHEACLYGRQFVVRYANKGAKPYLIANEPYHFGLHFGNSEVGGAAVRATTLLIRASTGDVALGPYGTGTRSRVVHSGRDFERRLHALIDRIGQEAPYHTSIATWGQRLQEQLLALGDENHEKTVRRIMQGLTRRKLTQHFIRRVVSRACAYGCGTEDALVDALPSERRLVLNGRTAYDLFTALIYEAKNLPIDQRETAEQVAYSLLAGSSII